MTVGEDTTALDRLVGELASRVPQPLDALELAAVAESIGITDAVAREDYGRTDVFELAGEIFPRVQEDARRGDRHHVETEDGDEVRKLADSGGVRSLLALAPLLALLLTMAALARNGWSSRSILALSFGITAAMILTSGPILAIGHRTSRYLGVDYVGAARHYLAVASGMVVGVAVTFAAVAGVALVAADVLSRREGMLFGGGLAAWSLLWVLVAAVGLVTSPLVPLAAIGAGVLAGAGGFIEGPWSGLGAGFGAALVASFAGLSYRLARTHHDSMRLPRFTQLLLEAIPYAAFGSALSAFVLEPHVIGWIGATTVPRAEALRSFELAFTLALPPILIASTLYERTTRSLWALIKSQRSVLRPADFGDSLLEFRMQHRRHIVVTLCSLSALLVAVVVVRPSGALPRPDELVFLAAVAGFLLMGIAQFDCFIIVTLSRPSMALDAVVLGIAAIAGGAALSVFIDFRFAALAFAVGAAAFMARASVNCRRLLVAADYHYANAF